MIPNWNARVIEVVVTNIMLRGNGTEKEPYRRVTQYWSKEGELLAERDPMGPVPDVAIR